jgi:hypothetical protein
MWRGSPSRRAIRRCNMRKYLLAACTVASVLGVSLPASAQSVDGGGRSVSVVHPEIAALLTQFPAGGPWLRTAIARAVQSNPSLTQHVLFAIGTCSACQGQSIRLGLADAADALKRGGSDSARSAESAIRTALGSGDHGSVGGTCSALAVGPGRGALDPGAAATAPGVTTCISPSRPGC